MSANSSIAPTAQGLILGNIKRFAKLLGTRGTVAGGAIRDLHCGITPKDYDLFVYRCEDFSDIEAEIYALDEDSEWVRGSDDKNYYNSMSDGKMQVSTIRVEGLEVQLIHFDCGAPTPMNVIANFDYTINMMAYADNFGFVIADQAKRSILLEELELNPEHRQRMVETNPEHYKWIAESLIARGHRIARKLGFSMPRRTIDAILAKYPYINSELLDMDL